MKYEVRIETAVNSQPLAVVRRQAIGAQLAKVVPEACGIVWNVIRAQKVAGAGRHVAIYLDGEINLEIGVELAAPFAGYGEVIGSAIPVGPVATATHFGPYGELGRAHQAIRDWCAAHGHVLAGISWEIYGHWDDAWNRDPGKIRTGVYYLLTPGGSGVG